MTTQIERAVKSAKSEQVAYIKQQKQQLKALNALLASASNGTAAPAQIEDIRKELIRAGIIDENNNLTAPYKRNAR
jgi:hypothetical protein